MNNETDRTKPERYQVGRWRWTPPGGYHSGFFSGFGLCMMIMTLSVTRDFISPRLDTIFTVGLAISVIATVVGYLLEALHDEDHDRKGG